MLAWWGLCAGNWGAAGNEDWRLPGAPALVQGTDERTDRLGLNVSHINNAFPNTEMEVWEQIFFKISSSERLNQKDHTDA